MKKIIGSIITVAMLMVSMVGCGSASANNDVITVISREDGSGTRGAFVELIGVEEKDDSGSKTDKTVGTALIQSSTDVVLTQTSGDPNAIGYISLGSLNDTVKALNIDGIEANADTVKDGSYSVSRPFNIATKNEPTGLAKDFINFILSDEGQKVVANNKYIEVESTGEFKSDNSSGKIVIAGSSSVSPVMEKLAEAYNKINTKATIEVQQSDSSSGMKAVLEGTCDIGMASRELKDTETELTATPIALDGIAIIVNKENTIENLTKEQVRQIYVGDIVNWGDVK